MSDIKSGADAVTIITDATQLAMAAAAGGGDTGLENSGHNIDNSIGTGTYSEHGSKSALQAASRV